jgi:hypothetical protein
MGRTVRLVDCDGFGSSPPALPLATVTGFTSPTYRLDFAIPFDLEGHKEHFAHIQSRHQGYPVSSAERMAVWVGVTLESGRGFIARVMVNNPPTIG